MKTGLIVFAGTLMLSMAFLWAEAASFTSSDGKTIKATLMKADAEKVQLKLENGKMAWIPRDRFDAETKKYIESWAADPAKRATAALGDRIPRLALVVNNGRTQKRDDKFSGYIDERKQGFDFRVVLTNEETGLRLENYKATLLVFGDSMDTGSLVVVHKKQWEELVLPSHKAIELNAGAFELWYDDRGAVYGYKYKGYLLVVEDSTGRVVARKAVPMTAEKNAELLLKFSQGTAFDGKYNELGKEDLSQSKKTPR